jgi:hypothetical protein
VGNPEFDPLGAGHESVKTRLIRLIKTTIHTVSDAAREKCGKYGRCQIIYKKGKEENGKEKRDF